MLSQLHEPIEGHLQEVEHLLREELRAEDPFIQKLIDHATQFGGKRIRPTLVLHAARLCGDVQDTHVLLAVIVELLHNATLIHDDVLDESEKRRNVPTVHIPWGNEAAILFGDFFFAKAFSLCASLKDPMAMTILAETTQNTCVGELIQVSSKFKMDMDEEFYLRMIRLKTASLFSASCQLGTIQTSAGPAWREALGNFGLNLGMAFQIIDDCLDIVGDEAAVGKSLGTDLGKGKWTLPVITLLRTLPAKERKDMEQWLLSQDSVPEKKRVLANMIQSRGVMDYAYQRARDHVEAAKAGLQPMHGNGTMDSLIQLADFVIERKN